MRDIYSMYELPWSVVIYCEVNGFRRK